MRKQTGIKLVLPKHIAVERQDCERTLARRNVELNPRPALNASRQAPLVDERPEAPRSDVFDQLWDHFTCDNDAMSLILQQVPALLGRQISPHSLGQSSERP